ncbi:Protein of unknown function [Jatrophihabitans endophyticus]|uniref:DUF559 domain-containing protein n=1 Tax=Jatrophihabitans endophyticus TaxID=1206085 RepID=A0A1M5GWV4_9ACTN|nr:DUF559 domain-containing protein [Jatrophihabitans endophyticus]SHG08168.1 Protein of unknown function [Jatrophihabitans endophyticus]
MGGLPDPDRYLDHVLVDAVPGGPGRPGPGPARQWQSWWHAAARGAGEPLRTAAGRGFVLTTAELAALGVTRSAARAAVCRGDWSIPARGTVAPLRVVGSGDVRLDARRRHALHAAALCRGRREHVVAAASSAVLHGLPVLRLPTAPELLAPARLGLGRRAAGHAYGAGLSDAEVTSWFGVPVTTVARTLVDLARHDARGGIMAADSALRERVATVAAIDRALAGALGWPGVRQARAVLGLADPLAESPLESVVRLALCRAGFPSPRLQYVIGGYRVDFCWPEQRLVLEADGRDKYTADALWREKRREHALRSRGWRVERILWEDVLRHWPVTAARLRAALAPR